MTDKKLKELLAVIDNRYGRVRSKEECIIEIKTCVQAYALHRSGLPGRSSSFHGTGRG